MKKSEALKILGLQDGASDDEVKKAHRKLVIENHPDKFGQDEQARAKAEEKTKLINEARDVLLSKKWDPEYSTAGTPYGAPFTYQPYTRPNGSNPQGKGQDPFDGWPFSGVNFVWTTWDSEGNPHTYRTSDNSTKNTNTNNPHSGSNQWPFDGSGQNPFSTSNPFTGSIPFDFSPFAETLTPEQMLKDEKKSCKNDLEALAVKLVLLILSCALGFPALGVYLFTVITAGQAVFKRLKALSLMLIVPFLLLALVFIPIANGPISILLLLCFGFALGYEISVFRKHYQLISTLKQKVSPKSED